MVPRCHDLKSERWQPQRVVRPMLVDGKRVPTWLATMRVTFQRLSIHRPPGRKRISQHAIQVYAILPVRFLAMSISKSRTAGNLSCTGDLASSRGQPSRIT
jgi:hypothetical protein